MKLAYWPGCVSRGFTTELHGSMALVAEKLGIELVTLDRANCCGAGVIAEHNQELADTLNARTFALAQQTGLAMMNICSTCQGAQSECQQRLDADAAYRAHVNEALADEGIEYVKARTASRTRTSSGSWSRTTASTSSRPRSRGRFQACASARSTAATSCDRSIASATRSSRPRLYLEKVIEALGGEVVEYDGARKCCGFPVITMNRETSLRQAGTHVGDAIDAGADCLVTPCPLCHLNLDMQQPEAAKVVNRDLGLAVLHLPQLVRPRPRRRAEAARDEQAHRLDRLGRGAPRRPGRRLTRQRWITLVVVSAATAMLLLDVTVRQRRPAGDSRRPGASFASCSG
jgi:succinate dehydrogenase / fumarate reductase cytochrome b subunit